MTPIATLIEAFLRETQRPMQLGAAASPHRQPSLLRTPPLASIEQPVRDREIPIALAAPSPPTTRRFLPWRLSDAGPGACLTVAMGRHPKPFTEAVVSAYAALANC